MQNLFSIVLFMMLGFAVLFSCKDDKKPDPAPAAAAEQNDPAPETTVAKDDGNTAAPAENENKITSSEKQSDSLVISSNDDVVSNNNLDENLRAAEELNMAEKIPLRPAMMVGSLAVGLTSTPTDLSQFQENKYVWNPAQIPLTELNKIVCVLANTGFHLYPNQGKYTAKIILEDCFSSQDGSMAGGTNGGSGSSNVKIPEDVLVETHQPTKDSDITIKLWFSRELDSTDAFESGAQMITWEPFDVLVMDYFVSATVKEVPNNDNPFGIFNMKWEMLVTIDGDADTKPYQQGYVQTKPDETNTERMTLSYNQKNWSYNDQECPSGAYGNYNGIIFKSYNSGTVDNGVTINFDGTSNISDILYNQGINNVDVVITKDFVMPAGTATVSGAMGPTPFVGNYGGIDFYSDMGNSLYVNPELTIAEVLNAPENMYGKFYVDNSVNKSQRPWSSEIFPFYISTYGGDMGSDGYASYLGLDFMIYARDNAVNGEQLVFDGTKTLKEVLADFYEATGFKAEFSTNYGNLVLPNGSVVLGNGKDYVKATASLGGISLESANPADGQRMNGFKLTFDGVKNVQETVDDLSSAGAMFYSINIISGADETPLANTVMVFSGGDGPPSDVYADIIEYAAAAEMELASGKPVRGKAHTAENWFQEKISGSCPALHTWTPQPVSYGLAFDRYDTYPGKQEPTDISQRVAYPGRSAVKSFSEYVSSSAATGFDHDAVRCEQVGGELANVWQWAIFDANGKRIYYKTDFPIFLENSNNPWGDGWVSSWGISIWGADVQDGDQVYAKRDDGSKRYFDVEKFNGVLRDDNWQSINTKREPNGALPPPLRLTCTTRCPAGIISQDMLDNYWDTSKYLYMQNYVFDFVSKDLYRDYNGDGGMDELIKIADGAQGWASIELVDANDNTKNYRYEMSTWSSEIALKENGQYFVPPKKINFDATRLYDNDVDAYPGSEAFNASHDGQALSTLTYDGNLSFEYGNLCCFDWEQKSGLKDEWGNDAYAQKVTLKKGTALTVDTSNGGDPDGSGPIHDGMVIKIAPVFTELRPISKNDCSADLESEVMGVKADMPLPSPLANESDRRVSEILGAKPAGTHPLLVKDGEKLD